MNSTLLRWSEAMRCKASKIAALAFMMLSLNAASVTADTDTTATLRGSVDIDNAVVTVVHEPTGLTKTQELGTGRNFSFTFLPVGGPYTISAKSGEMETTVSNAFLTLYQNPAVALSLSETMDEVVVYGQKLTSQGFGTGTTLDRYSMDGVPTVDRSIADFARLDPRVNINAASSNIQISAMGVNNRFNDFQIDGVSNNDPFGLNASGFGSLRNPISMDFVEQIAVDLTPFDVSRRGATGATIAVVTKSGSNEFDGSVYYTKRDEGNVGDLPNGNDFPVFEEEIFSATLSGPIIKDKLFFFVGYEEFEKTEPFAYGPAGSGAANESEVATADVFERIASIAQSRYGFDAGQFQNLSFPETAEEYTAKLDWNASDNHRFQALYRYKEELNVNNTGLNKFSTVSYTKPPETERYSFTYWGDLSDKLRVKARYTDYSFVEDAESGGGLIPHFTIDYQTADGSDEIEFGGEKFRGANYIEVANETFTLKVDYQMGEHLITAGIESFDGTVTNQFLARYNGEVDFDSIEDFEAGQWSYLRFQVPAAGVNALDTITANFDVEQLTYYLQDQWTVSDVLELQFGVRVDSLETPTRPVENAAFAERYGFTNAQAFDYTVVQPRASFSYNISEGIPDETLISSAIIRGGYGLFMGRFPNVWLGNAYSRPGPLSDYPRYRSFDDSIGAIPAGDPSFFWLNSPDSSYEIAAPGSNDSSQYVEDGFEAPSTWRGNIALDLIVGNGYEVTLEYNNDRVNEALGYTDPGNAVDGTLADGRTQYDGSGSLGLTNISEGGAEAFTLSMNKTWDTGVRLYAAYTNMDAEDVWNLTSSQAESNYGYQQRWGGNPTAATPSQYNVEHRLLAVLDYSRAFFGDNETRFSLIFNRQSGEPYSVTINTSRGLGSLAYGGYDLAYVPTSVNDSVVEFSSPEVAAAVMAHVDGSDLSRFKGSYAPRNAFTSPWITRMDIRITQEINLPEFASAIGENKALIYLDILNVGNLLDDDNGIVRDFSFNTSRQFDSSGTTDDGRIIYTGIDPDDNAQTLTNEGKSSWELRLGFSYKF